MKLTIKINMDSYLFYFADELPKILKGYTDHILQYPPKIGDKAITLHTSTNEEIGSAKITK